MRGRNGRWSRCFAFVIAGALVAASCGDDDDGDSSSGTAAETTTPASAATAGGGGGATTAASTSATTSSGGAGSTSATTSSGGTATAEGLTPIPDGVDLDASIVMAYSVPPNNLDPALSTQAADNTYMYMFYDRLTEISEDLEVVPYLATEWAYGADGSTFTMSLREDAQFHDGTPFNADAVVANINRSLTKQGAATARALAGVTGIEKIGEYEVQFNLTGGQPSNLPVLLAGNPGAMLSPAFIANETIDLKTGFGDVGSGPYKVVEYNPGQSASYVRAPNYWDPGRQLAAEFSISFVDPAARINGVRTGEFDLGQSAATDSAEAISIGESGGFNAYPYVINTVYGALFNPGSTGVLANQQIRQAIMHGMDRDAINEGLFEGRCEPRFQPFPEGNKYYFPEIEERYPFDPERARQLVAESGISDPSFDIQVSPGSYEPFAQVMQAQLEDIGITMNIIPSETSAVPVNFISGASPASYLVVLAYPDLASLYANWYGGPFGNMLNPAVPEAAAIRAAAAAANSTALSEQQQIAAWREVYTQIQELAVFAPGCAAPQVWMSGDDVIGVEQMPFIWQGAVVPYTIGKTG